MYFVLFLFQNDSLYVQREGEVQQHLAMFNEIIPNKVLAYIATKQGILQAIALPNLQALEVLGLEQ